MGILVTNNPLVTEQYKDKYMIEYIETDLHGVLTRVRDMIHKGHRLLTHPLMGSIKPNESPYKSIFLSDPVGTTDLKSVTIIEECIQAAGKFIEKDIPKQYLHDLQVVDLSLLRSAQVNR